MGKMYTYMITMCIIMFTYYSFGLLGEKSINGIILNSLLNPTGIFTSSLAVAIIVALTAAAVVGTATLGIIKSSPELAINSLFSLWIITVFVDFIQIFTKTASYNKFLAILLFAPFLVSTLFVVLEWFRGKD